MALELWDIFGVVQYLSNDIKSSQVVTVHTGKTWANTKDKEILDIFMTRLFQLY